MKRVIAVFIMGGLLVIVWIGCRSPQPSASQVPPPPQPAAEPTLAAKVVLMVAAPENFRDEELAQPQQILTSAGAKVSIASLRTGSITGTGGLSVQAELTVDQVTVDDYDAVVFVGGPGMIQYLDNTKLIDLAKKFHQANKLVAAICVAPVILANAGLLKGKSATVWEGKRAVLEAKGADYVDEPVVVADKIITANGPAVAEEFGQAIVKALAAR